MARVIVAKLALNNAKLLQVDWNHSEITFTYQVLPPQPPSLCNTSAKYHTKQTSVSSTEQNTVNMNIKIHLLCMC